MSKEEEINLDIIDSGGDFIPEFEVEAPTLSKEEQEEIEREKEDIRQLKILKRSPAWKKVKERFLEEIESMKFNITNTCDDSGSLEKIGQEFRIYRICEQKLTALIEEVESGE